MRLLPGTRSLEELAVSVRKDQNQQTELRQLKHLVKELFRIFSLEGGMESVARLGKFEWAAKSRGDVVVPGGRVVQDYGEEGGGGSV